MDYRGYVGQALSLPYVAFQYPREWTIIGATFDGLAVTVLAAAISNDELVI